LKTSRC